MRDWAVGLVVMACVPLAWRWAKANLPRIIATWTLDEVQKLLRAEGVQDADLAALFREIVLALVRFAQKKLPKDGAGPERMALIKRVAFGLPGVGHFFQANEKDFTELIEAIVADEAKVLDKLVPLPAPNSTPN